MPRVEIIDNDLDVGHDGSETIDLCRDCSRGLRGGKPFPDNFPDNTGFVGSTDVAHPPYEEESGGKVYTCESCGCRLGQQDN